MQRWLIILTTILAAEAAVRPQSPNGVVINELSTGVDWFEIANLGTASVDVSGWRLSAWPLRSRVCKAGWTGGKRNITPARGLRVSVAAGLAWSGWASQERPRC